MRRGFGRGILMSRWVQAVHANNVICLGGEFGLLCENADERAPSELRFEGSVFDGATVSCVRISSAARVRVANSWISSALPGANGIVVTGARARDVEFDECDILNTARSGLVVGGGASAVRLLHSRVYNCSFEKRGQFDAVHIQRDAHDWSVEDCTITNTREYLGRQRYGIRVDNGAQGPYTIKGNRLTGNLAGGLFDGGSGPGRRVTDNVM